MNNQEEKYIGYLKYSGRAVESGLLDTRKSAEALLGFDEILRYFVIKEDSSLKDIDFEIPVRIKSGSWEALIPEVIDKLLTPSGIVTATLAAYSITTARIAATDGISETGFAKDIKKVFRKAIQSAQWVIKIKSHLGTFNRSKFEDIKFIYNSKEIGIPNDNKDYLYVPKKYFDLFSDCPKKLFSKNAHIVERERILKIGVIKDDQVREEVSITEKEKFIFYSEIEDDNILFPELKHGQSVELEGAITRGNEKTDTLGFEYKGHILTCKPCDGNIASFKHKIVSRKVGHIFPRVKIIGIIDRKNNNGDFKEKRPTIIFSDIVTIEIQDDNSLKLFD